MTRVLTLLFCAFTLGTLPAGAASLKLPGRQDNAHAEQKTDRYAIGDGFVRVAKTGKLSAAYLDIRNETGNADVLTGATADWADRIEMHEMTTDKDGVMKMDQVHELAVPANGTLRLSPAGKHLMIFGLKKDLTAGQTETITLVFRDAGSVKADVVVRPLSWRPRDGDTHAH